VYGDRDRALARLTLLASVFATITSLATVKPIHENRERLRLSLDHDESLTVRGDGILVQARVRVQTRVEERSRDHPVGR
jgi:hypothetical protein